MLPKVRLVGQPIEAQLHLALSTSWLAQGCVSATGGMCVSCRRDVHQLQEGCVRRMSRTRTKLALAISMRDIEHRDTAAMDPTACPYGP